MRPAIPNELNGRPVRLKELDRIPRGRGNTKYWKAIEAHKWDGYWWRIPGTEKMLPAKIHKCMLALRKLAFIRGYIGDQLTIICSEADGVAFKWVYAESITNMAENEREAAGRRRERLVARGKREGRL